MCRVGTADPRAQSSHARHRLAEVVFHGAGNVDTEFFRELHLCPRSRCAEDALRRDTADIQAVAAQEMLFDQGNFRADTCGDCGGHEAGGSGADHHDVVPTRRLGIDPSGRVNVVEERSVVFVVRKKHHLLGHLSLLKMVMPCHGTSGIGPEQEQTGPRARTPLRQQVRRRR